MKQGFWVICAILLGTVFVATVDEGLHDKPGRLRQGNAANDFPPPPSLYEPLTAPQLARLDRRVARDGVTPYRGGGEKWALPWRVVQCESRGVNFHAGQYDARGIASGYYAIYSGVWKQYGGPTAFPYQATRAQQDRIAARIREDRGPASWVCWSAG